MNSIQNWLIEVAVKKMLPSLIRAAIAGGVGLIVAHAGILAAAGITYDPVTQTLSVHLGALQDWLVMGGLGAITALLAALQHHAGEALKKPDNNATPSGAI